MSASLELCGMCLLVAGERGLDSVDFLNDHLAPLNPAAVDERARPLFEAITENLSLGRPPTVRNVMALFSAISGGLLGEAKTLADSAEGFNKLEAAVSVINVTYSRAENKKLLAAALRANEEGDQEALSGIGPNSTCWGLQGPYRAKATMRTSPAHRRSSVPSP